MSQRSISYGPDRPDSQESLVFLSTGSSSSRADHADHNPTSLILDALQQHFTSCSTVYMHTSGSPSTSPTTSPTLGPGSPNGPKQLEESLYSWGPLNSIKRVIVVFYNLDNAEHTTRQQHPHPNHPACFLWCTYCISPRPVKRASPDRFYDETAILESPFHLHPPVPERNFLISPLRSPPVGWAQTQEVPPNEEPLAEDLQCAFEQLHARREQHLWRYVREWE